MRRALSVSMLMLSAIPVSASADTDGNGERTEIVVTANRYETDEKRVASSVQVIRGEDLRRRHVRSVPDALRFATGADIVRSGGPGGNTAVFLRGANPEHTLVLIDGVEINDPINPTRAFNFANLTVNDIDRIEILRGPQSTLYGSNALGGVIQIFTRRGAGDSAASASIEAGRYGYIRENARVGGSAGPLDYSVGVTRQDASNFSAAEGGAERDGYENTHVSARANLEILDAAEADLTFRFIDSEAQIDNGGGVFNDDPNRFLDTEQYFAGLKVKGDIIPRYLAPQIQFSFTDQEFSDDNDPDDARPTEIQRSAFRSRNFEVQVQNRIEALEVATILIGGEVSKEEGSSEFFSDGPFGPFQNDFPEADAESTGAYLQVESSELWMLRGTAGVRIDDYDGAGSEATWRVAPAFVFEETGLKLFGTLGTGFKSPSLFQRFSSFGREDLSPERSIGWDAGAEQELGTGTRLRAAYFYNDFENLIDFNPDTFIFENIASARTQGIEIGVRQKLTDIFAADLNYTYTDTRDISRDQSLLRRPRNKGSLLVSGDFGRVDTGLELLVVGKRSDNNFNTFPAERTTLGGYGLVNVSCNVDLTQNLRVFARVDNLFDKDYEDVFEFATAGRAGFVGVEGRI